MKGIEQMFKGQKTGFWWCYDTGLWIDSGYWMLKLSAVQKYCSNGECCTKALTKLFNFFIYIDTVSMSTLYMGM